MVGLLPENPALLSAFGTRERKYARFAFTDSLCCQEIGSTGHRSETAAQSTHKPFMDTPTVQFSPVWLANTKQQWGTA